MDQIVDSVAKEIQQKGKEIFDNKGKKHRNDQVMTIKIPMWLPKVGLGLALVKLTEITIRKVIAQHKKQSGKQPKYKPAGKGMNHSDSAMIQDGYHSECDSNCVNEQYTDTDEYFMDSEFVQESCEESFAALARLDTPTPRNYESAASFNKQLSQQFGGEDFWYLSDMEREVSNNLDYEHSQDDILA